MVNAYAQGSEAPVTYAGPQSELPGLDEVNILLPKPLAGAGLVKIVLSADGIESNTVNVPVQ